MADDSDQLSVSLWIHHCEKTTIRPKELHQDDSQHTVFLHDETPQDGALMLLCLDNLVEVCLATPFEAGPNTFKDNVKHLHRGPTSHAPAEAAQQPTSRRPLVQKGLSSRTTSNANAACGCPGAAPMARGTSTDDSRRRQLIARYTLLRTLTVWCAAS